MQNFTFRTATLFDLEALYNFALQLQQLLEQANPNVWKRTNIGRDNRRTSMREMLTSPDKRVIVVEAEDKVIGFASGIIRKREDYLPKVIGQVGSIFIEKKYRRRGIGTQLLKELYLFFKEHHVEQVVVNYIAGNTLAEAFWNRFHFTPVHLSANMAIQELQRELQASSYN